MKKVIVIVGPTGVGKTKMSISLAKIFNGEVINADSTQIYKGLDIATAKVKKDEKEGIIHHLFDIKDIEEDYTVYDYQKDCRNKIEEIWSKNKIPILVGGTGLYINAVLYDYEFALQTIKNDYSNLTNEELYNKLLEVNPDTEIHKNNRKRIERALDYYYETEEIISNNKNKKMMYDSIFIGLTIDRETLYNRIDSRVNNMVFEGLVDEAKRVFLSNIRTKAVMTPIGYKELFPFFENKETLIECLNQIKMNTRNYAKKQYTWFNNQTNTNWFDVDIDNFDNTIMEVSDFLDKELNI